MVKNCRLKNRKPAIDWQSRAFESLLVKSEVRSHDAGMADNARPNGQMSFGLRRLQHGCKRGLHIRRAGVNTIYRRLSKISGRRIMSGASQFLRNGLIAQSQRDCVLQERHVNEHNPNGVAARPCIGTLTADVHQRRNPVGVVILSPRLPRVARSSRPWALRRNPFGIPRRRGLPARN